MTCVMIIHHSNIQSECIHWVSSLIHLTSLFKYICFTHIDHNLGHLESYHYTVISRVVNYITCKSDTAMSESPKLFMTAQYLCGERRARRIEGHLLPNTVL